MDKWGLSWRKFGNLYLFKIHVRLYVIRLTSSRLSPNKGTKRIVRRHSLFIRNGGS